MDHLKIFILLIVVAYVSFAFSFTVSNWDVSYLDPSLWGWDEFRIGALLVFATVTAQK